MYHSLPIQEEHLSHEVKLASRHEVRLGYNSSLVPTLPKSVMLVCDGGVSVATQLCSLALYCLNEKPGFARLE